MISGSGTVKVKVLNAIINKDKEWFSKMSPYAVVKMGF